MTATRDAQVPKKDKAEPTAEQKAAEQVARRARPLPDRTGRRLKCLYLVTRSLDPTGTGGTR